MEYMIRIKLGPLLHKRLLLQKAKDGISMREHMSRALKMYLDSLDNYKGQY